MRELKQARNVERAAMQAQVAAAEAEAQAARSSSVLALSAVTKASRMPGRRPMPPARTPRQRPQPVATYDIGVEPPSTVQPVGIGHGINRVVDSEVDSARCGSTICVLTSNSCGR
eukprot:SAG31_NODE_5138_length_2719_cov_50.811832_2_plen_115_part_00